MHFIYRVLCILKALRIVLSKTINILRNVQNNNKIWDASETFSIGLYIHVAPSSDHSLMTLTLLFKVILRRYVVVF